MTRPLRLHAGHAIVAGLLLLALVLGWRAFGALMAPVPTLPPMVQPQLTDRPLLARFDPFFRGGAGGGSDLPVTALPFSLHGLRADTATGRGSAILAAGDGQQAVYMVGDAVGEGVTLVAIAVDHVVLDRAGVREALWLDSAGAGRVGTFVSPDAPPGGPDGAQTLSPEAEIDAMMARDAAPRQPDPLQPEPAQSGAAMQPAAPPEPR